jgi:hypothetical protein
VSKTSRIPVEKGQDYIIFNLLRLVTLGFYMPYYYGIVAEGLNIMAKNADSKIRWNFSTSFMYISLVLIYLPSIFMFADFMDNAAFFLLVNVAFISGIVLVGYSFAKLSDLKKNIIEIAMLYGYYDAVAVFEYDAGRWDFRREYRIFEAFNKMVNEYNRQ